MIPSILALAGLAGKTGYDIYQNYTSSEAEKKAREQALAEINKLQIPDIEKQQLALQISQSQGEYNPESQANAGILNYQENPATSQAQYNSLSALQNIANQGGLTAEDRANIEQINQQNAQQEQASRGALMQNYAARGLGGSGMGLAAQLQNIQSSATNRANQGFNTAAQAQSRQLQALQNVGQLGGQIRGQEFGMAESKGSAQDAINRFNVANRNQAMQQNLAEKQRLADMATQTANQQQIYNKGLIGQQYGQQAQLAGMKSGVYTGQAERAGQQAERSRQDIGNNLALAGQIGGQAYSNYKSPVQTGNYSDEYFRKYKQQYPEAF